MEGQVKAGLAEGVGKAMELNRSLDGFKKEVEAKMKIQVRLLISFFSRVRGGKDRRVELLVTDFSFDAFPSSSVPFRPLLRPSNPPVSLLSLPRTSPPSSQPSSLPNPPQTQPPSLPLLSHPTLLPPPSSHHPLSFRSNPNLPSFSPSTASPARISLKLFVSSPLPSRASQGRSTGGLECSRARSLPSGRCWILVGMRARRRSERASEKLGSSGSTSSFAPRFCVQSLRILSSLRRRRVSFLSSLLLSHADSRMPDSSLSASYFLPHST